MDSSFRAPPTTSPGSTSRPTGLQSGLAALQAQLAPRWQAMAPRERLGVLGAGLALLVLLIWTVGVQPALHTLASVPPEREKIDRQWQQMQRLAGEAQELRKLPAVPVSQSATALRSATERLGNGARINLLGDRATVTLTGIPATALLGWLGEIRSAARARVIDAQLDRKGDAYSGSVTIGLPHPG